MLLIQNIEISTILFLLEIPNYIDPGSASAVMAMIMGAIAGAGMTLKLYWFKIKQKISKN